MPAIPKPRSRAADKKDATREKEREWQRTRQCVLVRDGYRCRVCKSKDMIDAHHIRFRSVGGDTFDTKNVAAICRPCHAEIHAYRLAVSGDANGKLRFERLT
jgi:5-methylcytosine-specific restriction endonuclease McrA